MKLLAEELREARLMGGLSQQAVADAARISREQISRIEGGRVPTLSIIRASRIAAVLGLDLSVRVYPNGGPLRDAAHAERLRRLLVHVRSPLTSRTEVPLRLTDGARDQRAWDALILGAGWTTAVEMEMRIRDGQALERRINLKRRDDPTDGFLLLVADTRTNRRILHEHPGLVQDLPRLRAAEVLAPLESGRCPPTGLVFI